jgi:hypothetical protein
LVGRRHRRPDERRRLQVRQGTELTAEEQG